MIDNPKDIFNICLIILIKFFGEKFLLRQKELSGN